LLVRVLGQVLACDHRRIQFTPDLMPSDVIGGNVFNQGKGAFDFLKGPVFTQLLLADEINRAPAKTQSALLEAMQERQVTVDGITRPLPDPFLVMATQNPIESQGTYPLPESQMDRFALRIRLDYPSAEVERALLLEAPAMTEESLAKIQPVVSLGEIVSLQEAAARVHLSPELAGYIVEVAHETRRSPFLSLGISPRGELAWRNLARAAALARLLKGFPGVGGAHVNLIPLNPTAGFPGHKPTPPAMGAFARSLESGGVTATVRRNRGTEIDAACGQLRSRAQNQPVAAPSVRMSL